MFQDSVAIIPFHTNGEISIFSILINLKGHVRHPSDINIKNNH